MKTGLQAATRSLVAVAAVLVGTDAASAAIVVNTASDTVNPNACTIGQPCSLRDALTLAQGTHGWSINFAIGTGPQTISLMSNLPDIITGGGLDGNTQPGFAGDPLIEIRRSDTGSATRGLHLGQPPTIAEGGVTIRSLIIDHFSGVCADCGGIIIDNVGGNFIRGCWIGTDASGMAADGNFIAIRDNSYGANQYGGTANLDRNVISGNSNGISMDYPGGCYTDKNIIQGNYFGTNKFGNAEVHNIGGAVFLGVPCPGYSPGVLIGGPLGSGAGNVFAGIAGSGQGIQLATAGDLIASGNIIQGNFIGLDKTGLNSLPVENGIILMGDTGDKILDNVISVSGDAIRFFILNTPTTATTVQNNYIGTDISGNRVALVSGGSGINFSGGQNNTIGGSAAGQGNVIGGFQYGIFVGGGSSTGNVIQGNRIGIGAGGSPIPNHLAGIYVNGSGSTIIGGENPGEGNIIAFNGFPTSAAVPGISVVNTAGNKIQGNSIYSNSGLGIDLSVGTIADGVTPNDPCDADTGPNNLQNYPVITSVTTGSTTRIQGTLNSAATQTYRLEFFVNANCDGSVHGEGQTFIGYLDKVTDGSCNVSFDVTFPVATSSSQGITMTATDSSGNTSEFSSCVVSPSSFYTLTPCRVIDTRNPAGPYGGPALSSGASRSFVLAGRCGIPSSAKAVAVNIAVTQATNGPGFLTLYPGGTARPVFSSINYSAGRTRANNAIVPLGAAEDLSIYCAQGGGTVHLILDVNGYFQ